MGDIARQRTSCTLTPLSALLCVAALVLLFSLIGIFTRPPNLLAAFWPANAVLLGCMVRYPRLATPTCWAAFSVSVTAISLSPRIHVRGRRIIRPASSCNRPRPP